MSEAEAFGMCMPEIDEQKLTKTEFISRGGEGEVWKGTYAGHGDVAIKIVPILLQLGKIGKRDRTQACLSLHTITLLLGGYSYAQRFYFLFIYLRFYFVCGRRNK